MGQLNSIILTVVGFAALFAAYSAGLIGFAAFLVGGCMLVCIIGYRQAFAIPGSRPRPLALLLWALNAILVGVIVVYLATLV